MSTIKELQSIYLLTDSDGRKIYSQNLSELCTLIRETALNWDYDDVSLRFQIRKQMMSQEQIEKLPEYNG